MTVIGGVVCPTPDASNLTMLGMDESCKLLNSNLSYYASTLQAVVYAILILAALNLIIMVIANYSLIKEQLKHFKKTVEESNDGKQTGGANDRGRSSDAKEPST